MKKIFVFAAITALALTACQKSETVSLGDISKVEMSVETFAKNMTKGYVTSTAFVDSTLTVTAGTSNTPRVMFISAYNDTLSCDYFVGNTFEQGTDDKWHNFEDAAEKPIYYPVGCGKFQFLAYSVKDSAPTATWNGAKEVSLEVTETSTEDDILFAAGENRASNRSSTSMTFNHAQAWVTVNLFVDGNSPEDALTLNKITWKQIYTSGVLDIKYGTPATAKWNFFTQEPKDYVMNDIRSKYKNYVKKNENQSQFDFLIPAQAAKNFVISYTMGEKAFDYEVQIASSLTDGFVMGKHYAVNVEFAIQEITVAPEVHAWIEATTVDKNI